MALGIVGRGARALAEHLNNSYRVFKGVDADSIILRLSPGGIGEFAVRHSVTQTPILRVTDAGIAIPPGSVTATEIQNGAVTNAKLGADAVTTDKIADGAIMNADVNASAGIAYSKMAALPAGIVKSSGSTLTGGNAIINADVAAGAAIAYSKLNLALSIANGDVAAAAAIAYSKLNLALSIVNGDVAAGAAIALSKLAPGAAGVLKSNGTAIAAGNLIVTADMAANTINGDRIADTSIPSTKLIGGATVPANSIDASHIVDGSIMNAEINAAALIAYSKMAALPAGIVKSSGSTLTGGNAIIDADVASGAAIAKAKLAALAIVDADVAAGAAIAVAKLAAITNSSIVSFPGGSTGSASPVNIPSGGMFLSTAGGPVLVIASIAGMFNAPAAGTCTVSLFDSTPGIAAAVANMIVGDVIPTSSRHQVGVFLYTPSAAGHTYNLQIQTTSPSVTWGPGVFILIEFRR